MVDVATHWAYAVPLPKIDSATITYAVEDRLIGDGINPKMFIIDNGSEFTKDLRGFCEVYNIKVRKSVPHQYERHGLIEAFNRILTDAIGSLVVEEGGAWEESIPLGRSHGAE